MSKKNVDEVVRETVNREVKRLPHPMPTVGIDYSMGLANFDKKTKIHFGVISQNDILQAWADSAEPDYGDPTCPVCGNNIHPPTEDDDVEIGKDYYCRTCKEEYDAEDVFGDEPSGWTLDDGEYEACDCLDSDVMVLKSPYYTFAQYCSPCVPGAGNLGHYIPEGVKTYCFGHDWFEEEKAPYMVFSVETGKEVPPPTFKVVCWDDGKRVEATSKRFPSRKEAQDYADIIHPSRKAMVVQETE